MLVIYTPARNLAGEIREPQGSAAVKAFAPEPRDF
jgi:hypothetical protein